MSSQQQQQQRPRSSSSGDGGGAASSAVAASCAPRVLTPDEFRASIIADQEALCALALDAVCNPALTDEKRGNMFAIHTCVSTMARDIFKRLMADYKAGVSDPHAHEAITNGHHHHHHDDESGSKDAAAAVITPAVASSAPAAVSVKSVDSRFSLAVRTVSLLEHQTEVERTHARLDADRLKSAPPADSRFMVPLFVSIARDGQSFRLLACYTKTRVANLPPYQVVETCALCPGAARYKTPVDARCFHPLMQAYTNLGIHTCRSCYTRLLGKNTADTRALVDTSHRDAPRTCYDCLRAKDTADCLVTMRTTPSTRDFLVCTECLANHTSLSAMLGTMHNAGALIGLPVEYQPAAPAPTTAPVPAPTPRGGHARGRGGGGRRRGGGGGRRRGGGGATSTTVPIVIAGDADDREDVSADLASQESSADDDDYEVVARSSPKRRLSARSKPIHKRAAATRVPPRSHPVAAKRSRRTAATGALDRIQMTFDDEESAQFSGEEDEDNGADDGGDDDDDIEEVNQHTQREAGKTVPARFVPLTLTTTAATAVPTSQQQPNDTDMADAVSDNKDDAPLPLNPLVSFSTLAVVSTPEKQVKRTSATLNQSASTIDAAAALSTISLQQNTTTTPSSPQPSTTVTDAVTLPIATPVHGFVLEDEEEVFDVGTRPVATTAPTSTPIIGDTGATATAASVPSGVITTTTTTTSASALSSTTPFTAQQLMLMQQLTKGDTALLAMFGIAPDQVDSLSVPTAAPAVSASSAPERLPAAAAVDATAESVPANQRCCQVGSYRADRHTERCTCTHHGCSYIICSRCWSDSNIGAVWLRGSVSYKCPEHTGQ